MPQAAGLYYEIHGPETGEPVILSAGLGGSATYWADNIPALAERFRVIAYDHRGTGRSDRHLPAVVSVEDFAEDMLLLMDALEIHRAHIVGHAAGAVAALALALAAPRRAWKLVLVNGWAKPDPHFLRCFEMRLALLRHVGPEAYLRAQPFFLYPADWISQNSANLDALLPGQLSHFPGKETMEKRIQALATFDILDRLHEIDQPVLLWNSIDDMLVPSGVSDLMYDRLPNPSQWLQQRGGHAFNITESDDFNQSLRAWLAGEELPEE
jgi:aminoacrylate hydrolase